MILKLLAPVRTDLSFVSEYPNREPGLYREFWNQVEDRRAQFEEILCQLCGREDDLPVFRLPHASRYHEPAYNRYQSLDSNSLERPLHLLEFEFSELPKTTWVSGSSELEKWLSGKIRRMVCRSFDFGISLVEIDIYLEGQLQQIEAGQLTDYLSNLQQAGINLGGAVASGLAEDVLRPTFVKLRNMQDHRDPVIEAATEIPDRPFHGMPLWVTRTLVFEGDDHPQPDIIIRHWLKDVGNFSGEEGPTPVDVVVKDETGHMTKWLNYLFRERAYEQPVAFNADPFQLARPFTDAWEAMLYSQFYYSAMEVVDLNLTEILSRALSQNRRVKVDSLKENLERNLRDANLLLVQFHDNAKYYKRRVKAEMDDILDYWDFDHVLVEPVRQKIGLCQERLSILLQKQSNQSALFTDMILMGIGITSIFGFFLALADYGRSIALDVDLTSYDLYSWNMIKWIASQPTDLILFLSFSLSILLVLVYHYFRKRQSV